jgi:hypothetical protein
VLSNAAGSMGATIAWPIGAASRAPPASPGTGASRSTTSVAPPAWPSCGHVPKGFEPLLRAVPVPARAARGGGRAALSADRYLFRDPSARPAPPLATARCGTGSARRCYQVPNGAGGVRMPGCYPVMLSARKQVSAGGPVPLDAPRAAEGVERPRLRADARLPNRVAARGECRMHL